VAEAHAAIARIVVEVDGSRVTLTGTTRTAHYRYLAEHVAWQVPGVSEVRNEIRLEP
jgi:osmotically-inducible protein OsmY